MKSIAILIAVVLTVSYPIQTKSEPEEFGTYPVAFERPRPALSDSGLKKQLVSELGEIAQVERICRELQKQKFNSCEAAFEIHLDAEGGILRAFCNRKIFRKLAEAIEESKIRPLLDYPDRIVSISFQELVAAQSRGQPLGIGSWHKR